MTATMIARLVGRGTLTWDLRAGDTLGDAVPDMHIAYRAVTLEDLLVHRSGLVGAMTALEIWSGKLWRSTKAKADLRLDIATEALALPPETPPRSTFHYSNAGYVIAGAMAERAAGEPWDELMLRELFEPLGMNASGFGAPGNVGKLSQPWGHYEGRSRIVPVEPGLGGDSPRRSNRPARSMHRSPMSGVICRPICSAPVGAAGYCSRKHSEFCIGRARARITRSAGWWWLAPWPAGWPSPMPGAI